MSDTPAPKLRDQLQRIEERITSLLEADELRLPAGYDWRTALRYAWLDLTEQVIKFGKHKDRRTLDVVTQASVASALVDLVTQGLAVHKRQAYLIPYDDRLTCQPSYFGSVMIAKRDLGVRDVIAELVHDGDTFRFAIENGRKRVTLHEQTLESMTNGKILAAYAVVDRGDPTLDRTEIMTRDEIEASWTKSKQARYESSPHQQFPGEMMKRTVIERALKLLKNSAADDRPADSWRRHTELEELDELDERETVDLDGDPSDQAPGLPAPVDHEIRGGRAAPTMDAEPAPPAFEPQPARRRPGSLTEPSAPPTLFEEPGF